MTVEQVRLSCVTKVFMTGRPPAPLHALGPIDLELRRGEFFAVVGPSGCGKSTLLELIAALTPATAARSNASAPEPLAIHNGTHPRMNANDVIRIGRSRSRAPSRAASTRSRPSSSRAFANSTIRMAFLAASPMSITMPICA